VTTGQNWVYCQTICISVLYVLGTIGYPLVINNSNSYNNNNDPIYIAPFAELCDSRRVLAPYESSYYNYSYYLL